MKWTVPAVRITDYPRFGWRGIMLDVSRHFFTKADLEAYIDEIARLKYNTFHWHPTDDKGWRMEIKSLPKLTSVGAWRVLRSGHFGERADIAGINYSRTVYNAVVKTSWKAGMLGLELESEVPGLDIYFTIDDTMPDDHSTKYSQPLELPEGPITLRVITYRDGQPIGYLITLSRQILEERAGDSN